MAPTHQVPKIAVHNKYFELEVSSAPNRLILRIFTVGQIPGITMVTIIGQGFQDLDTLTCKFGEKGGSSRASIVSSTSIRCQSRSQIPGNQSLYLTYNDQDWCRAPYPFLSIRKDEVIHIYPTFGSDHGGTLVTIRGLQVKPEGIQFCIFGTRRVSMITATLSFVGLCLAPPGNIGAVKLFLENEENRERAGPAAFHYVAEHQVYSLMPSIGQSIGGTSVSILGSNFRNSSKVGCRFGSSLVKALFINSEMLVCRTVIQPPRYIQVEVTNNGLDFSRNGVKFLYNDMNFESIFPVSGPLSGGTQVRLRARSLFHTHTIHCMVGGIKIQMQRASAFEAWCVTPPSTINGVVDIRISCNDQEYITTGAHFEYQSEVHILKIVPSFGSLSGNTRVMIGGTGFVESGSLTCQFGGMQTSVHRFISSQEVECFSPSSNTGFVKVQVANNALDFGSSFARFEYHYALELHYLEPSTGVLRGSTAITFMGNHFRNTSTFSCRFGSVVVKSQWISEGIGFCSTPKAPRFGIYQFDVASNGMDWTDRGLSFYYYEPVHITSISPSIAPASSGQTLVTVYLESASLSIFPSWKCVYGNLQLAVPAIVISSEMLQCAAPRSAVGPVPFLLTRNGQNLEGGEGHIFHFVPDTTLLALKPLSGLTDGGTNVFLFGTNIKNTSDLQCRFGSLITHATYLSKNLAICISPPQAPGSVDVELSNAKISWTNSRLIFNYLLCPAGYFCPGLGLLLTCPAGSYCHQNRQANHTLCPPSTYQPYVGQTACLLCPPGRFCADEGLVSPGIPCIAGYVCKSRGLRIPQMPCPPGHFCLEGTLTSDTRSKTTKKRPFPCPRGFYCTYGVKTPVSEATNFSTPQPCISGYFCSRGSETPHGQGPCPSGYHCPTYAPGIAKVCGPGSFCPGVANTEPLRCNPGTSNR